MKDLFSDQSKVYANYRPTYPKELFDYIIQFVEQRETAWDCATGNGQAARDLSDYFNKVIATDISEAQLKNAVQKNNIEYKVCPAEQTPFSDNTFDLITVATAYHWLNWSKFYDEATRVGKRNAVIAVWAYNTFSSNDKDLNKLIQKFYYDIVYEYWDAERRHVENAYANVEFKFKPLPSKNFQMHFQWNKKQFKGYLESWSSVRNYIKQNETSPIDLMETEINEVWKDDEVKEIYFPLFMKIGRIAK